MHPTLLNWNNWVLPTYPFLIAIAVCMGLFWAVRRAMKWKLRREDALDGCLGCMVGALIGARLFYVFGVRADDFLEHPEAVFLFWRGGFVYYGGMLGALLGFWIVSKLKRFYAPRVFECILPLLLLQMAMGRLACFFAGCCYGRFTDVPWAVIFPSGSPPPSGVPLHPTQLYLSFFWWLTLIACLLWERYKPDMHSWIGYRLLIVGMASSTWRFVIEFYRNDDRGFFIGPFSQAQVISIAVFVVCGGLLVRRHKMTNLAN